MLLPRDALASRVYDPWHMAHGSFVKIYLLSSYLGNIHSPSFISLEGAMG